MILSKIFVLIYFDKIIFFIFVNSKNKKIHLKENLKKSKNPNQNIKNITQFPKKQFKKKKK